jgi:hypothetical protein
MPVPIKATLKELVEENYIEWNPNTPPETAIIIEGWERNVPYEKTPQQGAENGSGSTNIDYWLYH